MEPDAAFRRPLTEALGNLDETQTDWNRRAAEDYFASFSGRWFDVIADRDKPYEITERDLVAIGMLSVSVPGHTAAWILGPGRQEISECLEQIPTETPIWGVDEADLGPDSPASQLWSRLQEGCWPTDKEDNGIGWVTAGKLLAAKRPHLIPVYDRVVKDYLGVPTDQFWMPLRSELETPEQRLLIDSRISGASVLQPEGLELSLLRRIDIILWIRGKGWQDAANLGPPPS